jgi:hypothetical protein
VRGLRSERLQEAERRALRCNVSWKKKQDAFTGTVTIGNLNPTTGHFEFGFSLTYHNTVTSHQRRAHDLGSATK